MKIDVNCDLIKLSRYLKKNQIPMAAHQRIKAEEGVRYLLAYLGEDPDRPGLKETPARVLKALQEQTSGYDIAVASLFKTFEGEGYDGMVVLGPIPFHSLCEHHLLPFTGVAWVGYIPNAKTKRIVGLSKLARLVDAYARRLQVQERLTTQVVDALMKHLKAAGAGCLIESKHLCMCVRGVKKEGAVMATQSLRGVFNKPDVKAEFNLLCVGRR